MLTALCIRDSSKWAGPNGSAMVRAPLAPFGFVDVWRSELAALPALLVNRERAGVALDTVADWLALHWPSALALRPPNVEGDGAMAKGLGAMAARRSVRLKASNPRMPAALACGSGATSAATLDAKRRNEWGRLKRRLEDRGERDFAWSVDSSAIEDFLALKVASWKGERGTTLVAEPTRAALARACSPISRQTGDCGSHRYRSTFARSPPAPRCGPVRAFYWNTAFDSAFSQFSPGVHLTLSVPRDLETDAGLALADARADPNHTMIDRIWTARIALMDYALATRAGASLSFRRANASGGSSAGGGVAAANRRACAPPQAT